MEAVDKEVNKVKKVKVDDKNRFRIPNDFRGLFPDKNILAYELPEGHINFFPDNIDDPLAEIVEQLVQEGHDHFDVCRQIYGGCQPLKIEKNGFVCLGDNWPLFGQKVNITANLYNNSITLEYK